MILRIDTRALTIALIVSPPFRSLSAAPITTAIATFPLYNIPFLLLPPLSVSRALISFTLAAGTPSYSPFSSARLSTSSPRVLRTLHLCRSSIYHLLSSLLAMPFSLAHLTPAFASPFFSPSVLIISHSARISIVFSTPYLLS